jgi:hypothetical protein
VASEPSPLARRQTLYGLPDWILLAKPELLPSSRNLSPAPLSSSRCLLRYGSFLQERGSYRVEREVHRPANLSGL